MYTVNEKVLLSKVKHSEDASLVSSSNLCHNLGMLTFFNL